MTTTPDQISPYVPDGRSMYERMLAGEPYVATDPVLAELSTRAQLLTERYNATSITEGGLRWDLLGELLGTRGEGVEVRPPFHVDYGRHLHLGARTFANFGLVALDCAPIHVGADVQIAPNVQLLTATHPLEPGPRRDKWEGAQPIAIGDNVWLGAGVIVGPGVSIGENTVVGAGAVVTRDLPANVVAVGVPARPRRDLPADPDGGWSRLAVE
jgi:maltose O-acetyltransferase